MEKEIWKEIKGYENLYLISSFGNVKTLKTNNVSNGWKHNKLGYRKFRLYKDGKYKDEFIHRLVAINFLDNYLNKRCVNHIDNNPSNNNLNNLEFVTQKENMIHSSNQNRMNGNPKIVLNTENGIFYNSVKEAADIFGIKANTLIYKLLGKRKNNTSLKYV